jgi:hypothetical protein
MFKILHVFVLKSEFQKKMNIYFSLFPLLRLKPASVRSTVVDLCCYKSDPRIRTTDLRIRILLFSSVAFKRTSKNKFFLIFFFLLFEGL